ncbi:MAG: hypothetical protein R6U91_03240 [Bacillota bacterium]
MCCEMPVRQASSHHCCYHPQGRRFLTRDEEIEELNKYISDLKKELTAAEEHLKRLE